MEAQSRAEASKNCTPTVRSLVEAMGEKAAQNDRDETMTTTGDDYEKVQQTPVTYPEADSLVTPDGTQRYMEDDQWNKWINGGQIRGRALGISLPSAQQQRAAAKAKGKAKGRGRGRG